MALAQPRCCRPRRWAAPAWLSSWTRLRVPPASTVATTGHGRAAGAPAAGAAAPPRAARQLGVDPPTPAPVTLGQLPALVATTDAVFGRVAPKSMETDYPRVYAPENLGHVFAIPTDDGEGVAASAHRPPPRRRLVLFTLAPVGASRGSAGRPSSPPAPPTPSASSPPPPPTRPTAAGATPSPASAPASRRWPSLTWERTSASCGRP